MVSIDKWVEAIKRNEDVRSNVLKLKELCKEEPQELEADFLMTLLKQDDNKVRKNAAIIVAHCGIEGLEKEFIDCFLQEDNWIVKNEMIEAIKTFSLKDDLAPLMDFYETLSNEPVDDNWRHKEAMKGHLMEIFRYYGSVQRPQFIDLAKQTKIIMTTMNTNRDIIFDKLTLKNKKLTSMGILCLADSMRDFDEIRDYNELLLVLNGFKAVDFEVENMASRIVASGILDTLDQMHQGMGIYTFRIDVSSLEKDKIKNEDIKRLGLKIQTLSKGKLINNASDYDIELRLKETATGTAQVFLKLYTCKDQRFTYRKHALPTSLQPWAAASIADLIFPFTNPDAKIVDLCCGSGTLLIERHFVNPTKFMMGIDIYGGAIEMAKENSTLAGVNIHFVQRDLNRFTHAHQFDEVLGNLPVQSANKDRKSMETLYMQFMKKAVELCVPEGFIFVHTSETEIFKKTLRFFKQQVELVDEKKMIIRRGKSTLFILQMK